MNDTKKKFTQQDWVEQQLLENKALTRNQALTHYITRLGAIVCRMKKIGWEIEGRYIVVGTPLYVS